jgi:rhodanese-related sulfurtransferase/peroxiredoxin
MPDFSHLLSWKPLEAGKPATPLSLTADDGTWIKLPDFKGHLNVVLVFFHAQADDGTQGLLKALQANLPRFEELETAVFGVHTAKTDELRAFRSSIGIQFFLLYDPFAWESRGFRASSRIRPVIKDTTVIIGKDGNVLWSERGFPDVETLLSAIAKAEGRDVPAPIAPVTSAERTGADTMRTPGKGPNDVKDIESDQAVRLLSEKDSLYVLVDVRTKAEYDREHAPNAILIPVDELPHRYAEIKQTDHLIFVCQGGGRSAAAAEFMTSIGAFEIYNVLGGMSQWQGPKVTAS